MQQHLSVKPENRLAFYTNLIASQRDQDKQATEPEAVEQERKLNKPTICGNRKKDGRREGRREGGGGDKGGRRGQREGIGGGTEGGR